MTQPFDALREGVRADPERAARVDAWKLVVYEELRAAFEDARVKLQRGNDNLEAQLVALQLHHKATLKRLEELEAQLAHSDDWRQ